MAARFFLHGDHLTKVVLSGTPFLRPVQYDRMFLDSVQYGNLLHVFANANSRERFPGYIIIIIMIIIRSTDLVLNNLVSYSCLF